MPLFGTCCSYDKRVVETVSRRASVENSGSVARAGHLAELWRGVRCSSQGGSGRLQDGQPSSRTRLGSHLETGLGPPGEEVSLLSAPSGWQGQPHFLSWPPCLLLHFWPWPWGPRDCHLQVPAWKLGALGLPPATISCLPLPAHCTSQVVNEFTLPLSGPPARRACALSPWTL